MLLWQIGYADKAGSLQWLRDASLRLLPRDQSQGEATCTDRLGGWRALERECMTLVALAQRRLV